MSDGISGHERYLQAKKGLADLKTMQEAAERDAGNQFGLQALFQKELHNYISLFGHLYGVYVQGNDEVIPALEGLIERYEAENAADLKQRADAEEKAERKRQQSAQWRTQGLCGHCGGQLGFFKKCKACGKKS